MRPYGVIAAAVAVIAALFRARAWPPISRYIVDGPSMEPAYRNGDRLLVNRIAYARHDPAAGDVIVLHDPRDRSRFLLKRVALPPDGVRQKHDAVYVLGDNAAESRDSREFGAVPRSFIVGRAWRKY